MLSASAKMLSSTGTCLKTVATQMASRSLSTAAGSAIVSEAFPLNCFTEEEVKLRDKARHYARTVLQPHVREMDKSGYMKKEVLDGMFAAGFGGIEIEKEYGGPGSTFMASCLVVEEIAKVDPAVAVLVDIQNTLNNTLIRNLGTKEQKAKYLPRLAKDMVSSFCLSESGSGSDAFAMQTKAVKDGDHYVINGSKQWISNSVEAGVFIVMANADPSKGYKGITTFLVDRDTPGLSIGKKENKVPASSILGQFGLGYKYAISMLNEGRIGIAAQMIGLAQGVLEFSRPHFTEYANSPANRAALLEIEAEIEAAKLLVYNAARLREANQPFVMQAAMAKLYSSQIAERAASACIDWTGGLGATNECPAEKFYRDSKIGSIYEGTSNIQLTTIAKMMDATYQ